MAAEEAAREAGREGRPRAGARPRGRGRGRGGRGGGSGVGDGPGDRRGRRHAAGGGGGAGEEGAREGRHGWPLSQKGRRTGEEGMAKVVVGAGLIYRRPRILGDAWWECAAGAAQGERARALVPVGLLPLPCPLTRLDGLGLGSRGLCGSSQRGPAAAADSRAEASLRCFLGAGANRRM